MQRVLREGAFQGETHIVTGAASGIGHSVAALLAAHGAQVTLVDVDAGKLAAARDAIAKSGAPEPLIAAVDVTREADVARCVSQTLEATGCINGVVNAAGIARDARMTKKSFDDFKAVVAVHLHGTFLFTREVASQHWHPLFKQNENRPLADGVNRFVINFSSVSARMGNVGQADYTAAKGGIESLTKTTAREFASYGVRVNAIAPGPVETPMLAAVGEQGIAMMRLATLLGRLAQPDEIAASVCAIADPKLFGFCTGHVFAVNGGMLLD